MARYLVGTSSQAWDFEEAFNDAKNGDILEFEKDYWYRQEADYQFIINKDITIEGVLEENEECGRIFHSGAYTKFVISNAATVTFRNFWIDSNANKAVFEIEKASVLNLDTVIMTNTYEENEMALVYAIENSVVNTNGVSTQKADNAPLNNIKLDNATMNAETSTFNCGFFLENQATLSFDDVVSDCYVGNVINAKNNSKVIIKNSKIQGAVAEDDWPAIWTSKSEVKVSGSEVIQENYIGAIYASEESKLTVENAELSSFFADNSRVTLLDNNTIDNIILLKNESILRANGEVNILGKMSNNIDFELSGDSIALVGNLILNRIQNPNIRLDNNSFLYVEDIIYPEGNSIDINIEVSDDSIVQRGSQGNRKLSKAIGKEVSEENIDAIESINSLVGLNKIKNNIQSMINLAQGNQKRLEQGLPPMKQTLNAVFMGNPGTGKTTVARLLGKALFDCGALSGEEFKFVEVSEPDLISQNIGGTAIQTKKYLDQARGGVLFIDEAYTLNKKGSNVNYAQEAINTIMKYMEDYRDEIMIIFAGYTKEMEEFLKTNPGLVSRAPNKFDFEDYTADEIISLGKSLLIKKQFRLEDEEYYNRSVAKCYNQSLDKSNGRWIRNFNEKLIAEQINRVVKTGTEDLVTILNEDIDVILNKDAYGDTGREKDAFEQLQGLIGLKQVKNQVQEFITLVETNQKREELGLNVGAFTLHSLFLGNPGTGKTTVARIIGRILYQKGIIANKKFIEVSRSDLVAGYIGHTAIKTREVLESALGGVLFIDEAYTLYKDASNDFGKEAIEEILKFMEDHRRDIVIIFAGYTKEMGEFLQVNSGLRSRIPTTFDFEDYSADEISSIGILNLKASDYKVDEEHYSKVVERMYRETDDRSNGRWIRNFNEKLVRVAATRMSKDENTNYEEILNIDIDKVNIITIPIEDKKLIKTNIDCIVKEESDR